MNELRIRKIHLRNFKGVRDFTFEPAGYSASVFGNNAAGKTTVADAFTWLLSDQDSSGRADFGIKTLDGKGEALHGLEHEVEAELVLQGGACKTLRKVYSEKWTKKRGSADKAFSGHTTDHFLDGVPATKAEYDDAVAEFADAQTVRLLTDPFYFADALHWKRRREVLLEVCGDVTDADVIASNDDLAELPAILGERTLEEQRKVLVARRGGINDERGKIPTCIDEATRALPDVDGDEDVLRSRLQGLRKDRDAAAEARASTTAGGAAAERKARLREIDAEIQLIRNRVDADRRGAVEDLEARLVAARGDANQAKAAISRLSEMIAGKNDDIDLLERQMTTRRERWAEVDAQEFEHQDDDTCSACGQPIPEFKLKEARDKAEAAFNLKRSNELHEINDEGKQLKARRDKIAADLPDLEKQVEDLQAQAASAGGDVVELERAIEEAKAAVPEIDADPEYQKLTAEALSIEGELANLKDTLAHETETATATITELDTAIGDAEAMLARHSARANGLARIENLEADEQRLAREYEQVERHLHIMDLFVRSKVDLLTERINSRFELARFRLFDEQVNGGIAECCEVTYPDVPWRDMNHGARVAVGLDIVRTLQEHYNFSPPAFIDQAESVTSLPEMRCQLVRLVVSEADEELRVEIHREATAGAAP